MALQDIVSAMLAEGVSVEELYAFFESIGMQDHPYITEIIHQMLVEETVSNAGAPFSEWSVEDSDRLLRVLKSPAPLEDDYLEPWTPGFSSEVLHEQEIASCTLACLQDGEFKSGKTFFCSRCQSTFSGYDAFKKHRETHITAPQEVLRETQPSCSQNTPEDTDVDPMTLMQQPMDVDVQIGYGETPYTIERAGTRKFAKSVATETTYKVKFNDLWQGRRLNDLLGQLHRLFEELLARAREGINDNDLLRVVIRHNGLNHAVVVPLISSEKLTVQRILDKLENVLQSDESLSVDDSFQVIIGVLHVPSGTGRQRITKLTGPDNSIHKKTSMVQIVNDDQICMARAIGVGLAKRCMVSDELWRPLKDNNRSLNNTEILIQHRQCSALWYKIVLNKNRQEQKHLATLLCQKAGVPTDRPGFLNDIPSFEEALHIRVGVVAASLGNEFIRVPDNKHDDWPLVCLYLVNHEGISHFHLITSITGFFSSIYFCERCFKPYNHNTNHRCEITCLTCKSQNCPEMDDMMSCKSCHMTCRSLDCFERHKVEKSRKNGDKGKITISQCSEFWRCTTCKKVVNRLKRSTELHECTEWLCKCCKSWVTGNHQCYLFPEESKQPLSKYVFFDFEATQDTIAQCAGCYEPKNCCQTPCNDCTQCQNCFKSWCGQSRHVPNFVVAQTVCGYCMDEPMEDWPFCHHCGTRCPNGDAFDKELKTYTGPPCPETCGFREVIFRGDNTLDDFGHWLFSAQHKDTTVLAHNMKIYDGIFLLEYLVNNSMRPSKIIYNGSKIMYMEVAKGLNIRVLDSLNFLPMRLSALPKTFGLTELCKGYFPLFLTLGNTNSTSAPTRNRKPT